MVGLKVFEEIYKMLQFTKHQWVSKVLYEYTLMNPQLKQAVDFEDRLDIMRHSVDLFKKRYLSVKVDMSDIILAGRKIWNPTSRVIGTWYYSRNGLTVRHASCGVKRAFGGCPTFLTSWSSRWRIPKQAENSINENSQYWNKYFQIA
jgi:hypothetical protein